MKRGLALALASVFAVGACSLLLAACKDVGNEEDKAAFESYRTQAVDYVKGYNGTASDKTQKPIAQKAVTEIAKISYDGKKTLSENKGAVNKRLQTFRTDYAKTLETEYVADANLDDYLNVLGLDGMIGEDGQPISYPDSRTPQYNGLLANVFKLALEGMDKESLEYKMTVMGLNVTLETFGAGKASFSSGAVVNESTVLDPKSGYADTSIYTESELNAILALENEDLKERMLDVTKVSDIYRSSVVTFVNDYSFVVTNHYTQLGADYFNATQGKNYVVDKEYYRFGTYEIAEEPIAGTNEYNMNAKFDDDVNLNYYINASTGLVSRRDSMFAVMPYVVIDETTAATGGYDFDVEDMSDDDYVLSEGITIYKNVRYGTRTMQPFTDEEYEANKEQADKEKTDPSILTDRETLTLYAPKQMDIDAHKADGNGVVLLIHGGSWVGGEKESMLTYARDWANRGYFAVAINHTYGGRKYDNGDIVTFLDIQNEINQAMQKVKDMSDEYGWNINKCATNGYSSGSHLAAWYAYDMGNEETAPIPVVCTFSMVGPMSFYLDCWTSGKTMPLGPQVAVIALNDPKMFDLGVGDLKEGTAEYETYVNGDKYKKLAADIEAVIAGTKPRTELNQYDYTSYTKAEFDAKIDSISPLSFVKKGDAVPTVLAEACLDPMLISGEHGIQMEAALTAAGIEHTVIMFPSCDHMGSSNAECGNVYRAKYNAMVKKYFGY